MWHNWWNQWKSIFLRWWAKKSFRRAIASIATLLFLSIFTFLPQPVDGSAELQIPAVSLAVTNQQAITTIRLNPLMSLSALAGGSATDMSAEFPTLYQQTDAVSGKAACELAMWNVFGMRLVEAAITTDYALAAEDVSIASPRFYPAGHYFYSVTDLWQDTDDVRTAPAPLKSLTEQLGIALGSRSGANLKSYVLYFILMITQSGRVVCLLQTDPFTESRSSRGAGLASRWLAPGERRAQRSGADPPRVSHSQRSLAH